MKPKFEAQLAYYSNFAECNLLDYWSEDLCRDFVVFIGLIWDENGKLYPPERFNTPVILRFQVCQKIDINNSFSKWILSRHDEVSPGMNEFSLIRTVDTPDGWSKFTFHWEDDRYIEIECQNLIITKTELTPEMALKYPYIQNTGDFQSQAS